MAYDFSPFKKELVGTEEWFKREAGTIRTGQANPAVLDGVKVEVYGAPMNLKEVAAVVIEGARTLRVTPWDTAQTKEIEKALTASNLGLSIASDDQGVRISFPELTSERRAEIAKIAKEKLEGARTQVRHHRDAIIKDLQAREKAGGMGKDEIFRLKNETQKLVDDANKKLEALYEKKEKEILG
ncbi:MAG: ribosome recycling factor [Patescibacteria group bacterium]